MAGDVAAALEAFRASTEPRDGLGDNPFRLACSFDDPASGVEIATAWPSIVLPAELVLAWSSSRESRLLEDVDYGQWGLVLLSPASAAQRTAVERAQCPVGFNSSAVVLSWAYAAVSYLLIKPPRIFVRVIRGAGNETTFGSWRGARRFSPWPWCVRPEL